MVCLQNGVFAKQRVCVCVAVHLCACMYVCMCVCVCASVSLCDVYSLCQGCLQYGWCVLVGQTAKLVLWAELDQVMSDDSHQLLGPGVQTHPDEGNTDTSQRETYRLVPDLFVPLA